MKTIFRPGMALLAILIAVSLAKAETAPGLEQTPAKPEAAKPAPQVKPEAAKPATPAASVPMPTPDPRRQTTPTPATPAPAKPVPPMATSIFEKMTEGENPRKVVDVMLESGVNAAALKKTLTYFDQNQTKFTNRRYITLIDYSKPSTEKRMYVFEVKTGKVERYLVAHGMGSGGLKANTFSNTGSSGATSLGFYKTAETYVGKHGRSLRLDGLSSTNSRARQRAVVMHAAGFINIGGKKIAYVSPEMIKSQGRLGRSQGCPALDPKVAQIVIDELRLGSLIYAFN